MQEIEKEEGYVVAVEVLELGVLDLAFWEVALYSDDIAEFLLYDLILAKEKINEKGKKET